MSVADLMENVDRQVIKIRTNSLDVSFNELYDMYRNEELIIAPDYQRLFRWGEETQSRFMESLILEMPVPPIYVVETSSGIYELIDGLQRISSYLHFRGEPLGEGESAPLVLSGCDIVPDLNGLTFAELPKAIQIKLKRSFVRMEVIHKESEPTLKYHMFKRLNTGGLLLSAQEIRNCTIRLLGDRGINFIEECSRNEDFMALIKCVGEERLKMRYDQELVLHFFVQKTRKKPRLFFVSRRLDEELTKYLEKMTFGDFAYERESQIFCNTFGLIRRAFGEKAFTGRFDRPFDLSIYNAISYAISEIVVSLDKDNSCYEADKSFGQQMIQLKEEYFLRDKFDPLGFSREVRRVMEGVREDLDGG